MVKKIISAVLLAASSSVVSAGAITLYQDTATGFISTKPGPGRVKLGNFVNQEEIDSKIAKRELKLKKVLSKTENSESPEFPLGKETAPSMKIHAFDNPDMWLKIGIRLQGTFENRQVDYADRNTMDTDIWDAYLRRARLEVGVGFFENVSFAMDIRNDKANYADKGEQGFNIGDAYLKIKRPFGTSLINFKLYRAKIDISRTETVKSAYVLHYDRPHVADEAAQYISHNRRATNAQMYGNWKNKIHYQIAFGDGVYSGKLKDASGRKFSGKLDQKSFFYGGKITFSPFEGWEEKRRTETYFAKGKHFSVGASYWKSPDISYDDGIVAKKIDHRLINYEISAHYLGAFVQAEYFDFDGIVKKWGESEIGKSNGWYVTGEYLFKDFYYIAPFARYENWDKWKDTKGYDLVSRILGINWYLRGNSTKIGLSYQRDEYEKNIGNKMEDRIKLTSQWFF